MKSHDAIADEAPMFTRSHRNWRMSVVPWRGPGGGWRWVARVADREKQGVAENLLDAELDANSALREMFADLKPRPAPIRETSVPSHLLSLAAMFLARAASHPAPDPFAWSFPAEMPEADRAAFVRDAAKGWGLAWGDGAPEYITDRVAMRHLAGVLAASSPSPSPAAGRS